MGKWISDGRRMLLNAMIENEKGLSTGLMSISQVLLLLQSNHESTASTASSENSVVSSPNVQKKPL